MARVAFDEFTRIAWVTSIASVTAPTAAELTAGVDLTTFVTKDGIKHGVTNNKVDMGDISTSFGADAPGTYKNALGLKLIRDTATDTAWTTLSTRGTAGFVAIRKVLAYTTAWTAGQKVEIYPATTLQPTPDDPAENAKQGFVIDFAVTSKPALAATVS